MSLNRKPSAASAEVQEQIGAKKQEILPEIPHKKSPFLSIGALGASMQKGQISNENFLQTVSKGRYPKPMSTMRSLKGASPKKDSRGREKENKDLGGLKRGNGSRDGSEKRTSKDPKEIKNEFESINEDQSEQEQDDKETQ
jgi:hypothetical protein